MQNYFAATKITIIYFVVVNKAVLSTMDDMRGAIGWRFVFRTSYVEYFIYFSPPASAQNETCRAGFVCTRKQLSFQ